MRSDRVNILNSLVGIQALKSQCDILLITAVESKFEEKKIVRGPGGRFGEKKDEKKESVQPVQPVVPQVSLEEREKQKQLGEQVEKITNAAREFAFGNRAVAKMQGMVDSLKGKLDKNQIFREAQKISQSLQKQESLDKSLDEAKDKIHELKNTNSQLSGISQWQTAGIVIGLAVAVGGILGVVQKKKALQIIEDLVNGKKATLDIERVAKGMQPPGGATEVDETTGVIYKKLQDINTKSPIEQVQKKPPELHQPIHSTDDVLEWSNKRAKHIEDLLSEQLGSDVVQAANKNLKKLLDESNIYIRIPDKNALEKIISDGRLKTCFEGIKDESYNSSRFNHEKSLFGMGEEFDKKTRPVYGYMAHPDNLAKEEGLMAKAYGHIALKLKESARARSTVISGDSFGVSGTAIPTALSDPSVASLYGQYHDQSKTLSNITNAENISDLLRSKASKYSFSDDWYMESQIHGGVSAADIEEIIIEAVGGDSAKISDTIVEWASNNNIKITIKPTQ